MTTSSEDDRHAEVNERAGGGEKGLAAYGLYWVIAGGETGPGARSMPPGAARSLRDQCASAGAPFFYKGVGTYAMKKSNPNYMKIDGKEWKEFPEVKHE